MASMAQTARVRIAGKLWRLPKGLRGSGTCSKAFTNLDPRFSILSSISSCYSLGSRIERPWRRRIRAGLNQWRAVVKAGRSTACLVGGGSRSPDTFRQGGTPRLLGYIHLFPTTHLHITPQGRSPVSRGPLTENGAQRNDRPAGLVRESCRCPQHTRDRKSPTGRFTYRGRSASSRS